MSRPTRAPHGTSALLVAGLIALGMAGAGCARDGSDGSRDAAGGEGPATITLLEPTLAPLVDRFNRDRGKARVVALLSPT